MDPGDGDNGRVTAGIEAARAAFDQRDWAAAHAALTGRELEAEDLERLAVAAFLLARDEESATAWEGAHRAWAAAGEADHAARCACWLALTHLLKGEAAQGSGWLARAERIIDDVGPCAARGLALVPTVLVALDDDDPGGAGAMAAEMVEIGRTFADADVTAFGLLTSGEAAIAAGDLPGGMRLLDEVMVAIAADDVSPITVGIVYCAVIEGCMRAFDLRRASEWTEALRRWCAGQPDLVPYRGQCLVHRSQVLQAQGSWAEAVDEVDRASELLSSPAHPALAVALYQRGELHRVRGDLREAERAYRAASRHGYEPVPGFALLRLAQGKVDAAMAAVERMLDQAQAILSRPAVLAAAVEVFLAAGEIDRAREARDELAALAEGFAAPMLGAAAAYASGTVQLAEGRAGPGLVDLRLARDRARELDLPYEEARARVQVAVACRAVGDDDGADLELEVAVALLGDLGARLDLEQARVLQGRGAGSVEDLTGRECEVLRLVATGQTNREVGATLSISEHTVARHLQNIFTKAGLTSRAAATAYAYERGLVGSRGED